MKSKFLFLAGLAFLTALFAFSLREGRELSLNYSAQRGNYTNLVDLKKRDLIRCSPNWDLLQDWLEEADIPPNWSKYA